MPFLRQARGLSLQPRALLPSSVLIHPSAIRHASHWNKHKRNHAVRDSQDRYRSDHDTGSDKHPKPLYKSITPDFLTHETDASSGRRSHFSQVSSFSLHASHKSGSKPTVEASSTSWDSKTNEVKHSVYDPISGRMVPAGNGRSRNTSTSAKNRKGSQNLSESYQKPNIVSQSPVDADVLTNTPTTHASFTEDFEKTYTSEHEELLAVRRHLNTLREQIQVLERQAHPELVKPQDTIDAERPPVFEDGWDSAPKGLQTAFKHEKEACENGDMEPLEQEMAALNKRPVQMISDDCIVAPGGMETLFAHEQEVEDVDHKSSLEQELVAMNTKAPPQDDGYSASPTGLETLYEQEKQNTEHGERVSLEDEVKMTGVARGQPRYTDSHSKTGFESMYDREQKRTPQRLELELGNMPSSATVSDPHDAYSTEPIGMQTLYEREEASSHKGQHKDLEQELRDHIQARSLNNSFLPNMDGMQSLWKQEQEQVEKGNAKSLEQEIQARQQPAIAKDKYDTTPFGMETHFRDEAQGTGTGGPQTLEEEMSRRAQAQTNDDSCSRSPSGLQTAFDKEKEAAMLGLRQSLESEMSTPEPAFEDGYSTMPMGLQMMFRREKQGDGRTLEDDLKQMEEASYHEDGYSRAPIDMESSFDKEMKPDLDSLEKDFKSIPGEGDLSPTVGKFATSDKWYKQPSRSTFSEDSPKADNDELPHAAVLGHSLNEKTPSRVENNVPSPKSATATDDHSPTTIPERNSTDACLPPASTTHVAWAEPPLYKVIAYDSGKDIISITTTPSNFSDAEAAISIPHAVSQLDQTARFIPHLAFLQNEGFQVIHAERDFLILRKVHKDSRSTSSRLDGAINPVDGTTKHIPVEPPTARFASPTGFVNYEPIFTPEPVSKHKDALGTSFDIPSHRHPDFEQQVYYPSPVDGRIVRKPRDYGFRKEKRGRWRRRSAWLLSVAAGTTVSTYAIGVSGELSRPEKHVMQSSR